MERLIDGERRLRCECSAAFKALVLEQTRERGASVSGVALRNGLHPNMVHCWLREQCQVRELVQQSTPAFVPLPAYAAVADEYVALPATPTAIQPKGTGEVIRVKVQRGGTTVTMEWPVAAAAHCAHVLGEWLR